MRHIVFIVGLAVLGPVLLGHVTTASGQNGDSTKAAKAQQLKRTKSQMLKRKLSLQKKIAQRFQAESDISTAQAKLAQNQRLRKQLPRYKKLMTRSQRARRNELASQRSTLRNDLRNAQQRRDRTSTFRSMDSEIGDINRDLNRHSSGQYQELPMMARDGQYGRAPQIGGIYGPAPRLSGRNSGVSNPYDQISVSDGASSSGYDSAASLNQRSTGNGYDRLPPPPYDSVPDLPPGYDRIPDPLD